MLHFREPDIDGAEYVEANTLVFSFVKLKLVATYHGGYRGENITPLTKNTQAFQEFIFTLAIFMFCNKGTHIDIMLGSAKADTASMRGHIRYQIEQQTHALLSYFHAYLEEEYTHLSPPFPLSSHQERVADRHIFGELRTKERRKEKKKTFKKRRSLGRFFRH